MFNQLVILLSKIMDNLVMVIMHKNCLLTWLLILLIFGARIGYESKIVTNRNT